MDKTTDKRREFACSLRTELGLVLKGCWLPDTGLVHFSTSPPPCLSFSNSPQHHFPLTHFLLIQAGHLLNTPVTLSICPCPPPRPLLSPFHSPTLVLLLPLPPHLCFHGFPLLHPTTTGTVCSMRQLVCPIDLVFQILQRAEPEVKQ